MKAWTVAHRTLVAAVLLFLPAPILIVVLSSFTKAGYIGFPPGELSLRWYAEFLGSADWLATSLSVSGEYSFRYARNATSRPQAKPAAMMAKIGRTTSKMAIKDGRGLVLAA